MGRIAQGWDNLYNNTRKLPTKKVKTSKLIKKVFPNTSWKVLKSYQDPKYRKIRMHPKYAKRVKSVSLNYPVIISKKTGYVIDGNHRIMKAWIKKKPTIKVRVYKS